MRHEPRLPRDDVNVTRRHPLKEGALMIVGLAVLLIVLLGVTTLLIDRLVPHFPQSWEARFLPDFELVRHLPETAEETEQQELLEALLSRLVERWPESPEGIRVGLLDNDQPNALALPGGLLLVTTGLVGRVESENELAFVLGHELGHYRGRDHLRSLGRGLALSLVLAAIGQSGSVAELVALSGQLAGRSFGREQELDADAFGLSLVAAEYGHVNGAADFFDHLPSTDSELERSLASYLATHPLSDDRIEAMENLARANAWQTAGEKVRLRDP